MAHGFNSFMGNKDFHPGSFRNLKKVWEVKQQLQLEEKRQEELKLQYVKEQEQYQSKELMGKANPMSFMYEPPPSFAKDKEAKSNNDDEKTEETKLKFDWQKEGKAPPRESYAKDDMNIRDQPFGIEVRNVRCIKCGKMGHVNTDRECPLYGQAKEKESGAEQTFEYPIITNWDALDDGLQFKQCVKDRVVDGDDPLQQFVHSDDETEMIDLLTQFSPKQRKKILKKLAKAENKDDERFSEDKNKKRKHKKDRKTELSNKKRSKHQDSSHKHRKRHRRHDDDSSESDLNSSSSNEWVESTETVKRKNKHHRTDHRKKEASREKRRK